MTKENLTVRSVEAWQPDPARRIEVADAKCSGLYLIVAPSGAKSWAVRYRFSGKPCKLTIGPFPTIGLADARQLARDALLHVAGGRNPADAKRQAREAARRSAVPQHEPDTMERIVSLYIERHCKRNTRSWTETERLFRLHVLPIWGTREIHTIQRRDVYEIIDGIVDRGFPVQANRVLAAASALFNWAVSRDIVAANPAASIRRPTREHPRDRVLGDAELAAVWQACDGLAYPAGPLFRCLILTGARRDEVRKMQWREVDLETAVWVLPAARSKNKHAHVVPLSPSVMAILRSLPRFTTGDFVFSCDGGISPYGNMVKPKAKLDRLSGVQGWMLHDIRRTVATGLGELGIAGETIARLLNHVERQIAGVTARYERADHTEAKRRALETWARHVEALGSASASNVVLLHG